MTFLLAALLSGQDLPERLGPGLALSFEGGDARETRLAALYVPEGECPTPFLPAGPFKAEFSGFVSVDIGTDVLFSAEGSGKITLLVRDAPVLEAFGADSKLLRLKKGRNALMLRYESPPKGDAWVRLYWATAELTSDGDWAREPVPPAALSHDADSKPVRLARLLREGREILETRRCLKCHAHGRPDPANDAPDLTTAGARMNAAWMARWILDPRAERPEATMPRVKSVTPAIAADAAAWLATLGTPADAKLGDPAEGGRLVAELRCVGCHTLPDRDPAPGRIPLRPVAAKWKSAALRDFLMNPRRHFEAIRMPDFRLTEDEAGKIAAFLLSKAPPPTEGPAGDPARGREWLAKSDCMGCHKLTLPPSRSYRPLRGTKIALGCPVGDFGFTAAEKEALQAFAATDLSALVRESAPEYAERQIRALRCGSCHKRDADADDWSDVKGEAEGLIPKPVKKEEDEEQVNVIEPVIPSLSWAGEKLKPEWTGPFISGENPVRLRPWLAARMPAFPRHGALIARGLSLSHGHPPASRPEPAPDPELADIGLQLAGKQAPSLACTACHDTGAKKAVGVFEAPGPNLARARERIRKEYYGRWMMEPLRVEPGTKMPTFAVRGRSQLVEVLEGDGRRQFEALWQWLLEGEAIRPPKD